SIALGSFFESSAIVPRSVLLLISIVYLSPSYVTRAESSSICSSLFPPRSASVGCHFPASASKSLGGSAASKGPADRLQHSATIPAQRIPRYIGFLLYEHKFMYAQTSSLSRSLPQCRHQQEHEPQPEQRDTRCQKRNALRRGTHTDPWCRSLRRSVVLR